MALLEFVNPEDADEEVRALLQAEVERYGQPTLFGRLLAHNPDIMAARAEYAGRIVDGGALDSTLKELAYVAVSDANDCAYCAASHVEHLVERVGLPEGQVRAALRGDREGFDERERAAMAFAEAVARDPKRVGEADLDPLYEAGFDDADVVELLVAVAAAVAANTIADAMNVHPADRGEAFADYAAEVGEE